MFVDWVRFLLKSFCCLMLVCATQAADAQSFTKLSFQPGQDITASGYRLRLEEPDNPSKPTLWQGPLTVTHGTTQCKVDASLIRDAYLSPTAKLLVVVSISGSNTFVQFFRSENCTRAWPQIKAFTEGIKIEGTRLTVLPACECPVPDKPCSCSAGAVYRVSDNQPPRRLTTESNALNRRRLGQAFTGTKTLAHPPSPPAP